MVASLFLFFLLSVFELGFFYTRVAVAETALLRAARFVYTGAATNDAEITQASIEQYICEEAALFGADCRSNVAVEVRPVADLVGAAAEASVCRSSSDEISPTVTFDPGGSSEIMIMKACFTMRLFNPAFGWSRSLARTDDDRFQLTLATAFMNEPF